MAAVTPDLGFGVGIAFSSSFLAKVLSVSWSGIEREWVDTTTLDMTTGGRTFMPKDVYDPGSLSVQMQFDTDASPPITSAAETITITFPDGETWAASGGMASFEIDDVSEDVMTATAELKFSGDITF